MPTIYCRHIRPSGRRCQTPALRGKPLCFHHATAKAHLRTLHPPEDGTSNIMQEVTTGLVNQIRREPLMAEYFTNARGPVILDFPPLEDANSVQLALSMVLTVLGQNRLEPGRAASMLYNLQIAAGNAKRVTNSESHSVRDIVYDDAGNLVSPDEDPEEVQELQQFLKESDAAELKFRAGLSEEELADLDDEEGEF
jgi:hypothetical protein